MKEDILADLRELVRGAIENGDTLEHFRKGFDQAVARRGWGYKGGRNWRTRVIYETNLYQAHNAGRYQQLQEAKRTRPYWRYRHNDAVEHPRPEHLAWDGLVLAADDPWWDTHMSQNGWGCKCFVESLSKRDMQRLGKTVPDRAPATEWQQKLVGVRGPSPRSVRVPKGVDPGFAYNPGKAAFGEQRADGIATEWSNTSDDWVSITPEGWAEAGRPPEIPLVKPPVLLGPRLTNKPAMAEALREQLGAESRLYKPGGVPVYVHAGVLAKHLDTNRSEFLPLLDDVLSNPFEIWLRWDQHKNSGRVRLRARIIKGYDIGRGKVALFVGHARGGYLEGWTYIPSSKLNQMNRRRTGVRAGRMRGPLDHRVRCGRASGVSEHTPTP